MLWSEISFYCDRPAQVVNAISDHKSEDLPPQMTIFNIVIPILMHFFTFSPVKVYYFAPMQMPPAM